MNWGLGFSVSTSHFGFVVRLRHSPFVVSSFGFRVSSDWPSSDSPPRIAPLQGASFVRALGFPGSRCASPWAEMIRPFQGRKSVSLTGIAHVLKCVPPADHVGNVTMCRSGISFQRRERNCSTVKPASRISALRVPFEISRWSGTTRRRWGGVVCRRIMWLPRWRSS